MAEMLPPKTIATPHIESAALSIQGDLHFLQRSIAKNLPTFFNGDFLSPIQLMNKGLFDMTTTVTAGTYSNSSSTFFDRIQKRFKIWQGQRTTMRELNALSDRELQDIGISRGMIPQIAREFELDNH